jgi:hypothetical protein
LPGSSSSNNNGRALEYFITHELSKIRGCELTDRALADQLRDARTIAGITKQLRKSFIEAAGIVAPWVLSEIGAGRDANFKVDRHQDSDPGVADLTVTSGSKSLRISVKHNHDALSHPRPYSLADRMGISALAFESDHRDRLDKVTKKFRSAARGATSFPMVPTAKLKLYQETCAECAKTVNSANAHKGAVSNLFSFLVGSDFKKLIVETNRTSKTLTTIKVMDYTRIKQPKSVAASVENRLRASSLILNFDNGWTLDLRIKNASTKISPTGQVSLKFDAQKTEGPIPPLVLLY